jgi:arylformamidase
MYIELSYPINQEMPVAPNLPRLEIIPVNRMSQNAHSNTTIIKIFSHGGTHVDAPFHFYDRGKTIEQIPIDNFVYEHPLIIQKELQKSQVLEVEDLRQYGQDLYAADILFFCTGYCKLRTKPELYLDDYPSISEESARFIRTELLNVKAIAIDTPSIERVKMAPKTGWMVHKTLLDGDLYPTRPLLIYEEVNIDEILDNKRIKRIYAFPLRLTGLDASPVNMVAEV